MNSLASVPKFRDREWEPRYSREDGDLAELFFDPALACATLYQRLTGYFSADALALAARGIDALIRNGGRMELVVGCTLQPDEVQQLERGYALRDLVETGIADRLHASGDDPLARERLGWAAWMVAKGHLDIRIAVPKDAEGRFRAGLGLYHAKCGIVTDAVQDRIAFEGSVNETHAGWKVNGESLSVSCSWEDSRDRRRVEHLVAEFSKLWANRARSAEVMSFPEACRRKLLEFLPKDDQFVMPPRTDPAEIDEKGPRLSREEKCRLVWSFIANAPKRPDGALVAVHTSAIVPWPHQLRAYKRMLDSWPCRLLIADEVGLGKTIEAGLIIRHAWISGLAKRILILVPAGLLSQWQAELYEKFNLLVPIYTGESLRWPEHHFRQMELEQDVARGQWTKTPLALASSHLMRRAERQGDLIDAQDWDLLVLDEAHHARRRGAGSAREKGPNRLLALMERIAPKAKSLLLMTATPMQVDPVEIWDLVRLLGIPNEWGAESFRSYFEALSKNPDAAKLHELAKLFQACERDLGPVAEVEIERVGEQHGLSAMQRLSVVKALREPSTAIPLRRLSVNERKAAIALLRASSPLGWRMSRATRALLREYFKRGLLAEPIATRDVLDDPIPLTAQERAVYDAVEDYISTTYQAASPDKKTAVGFVMTVYRLRLASSFHALKCTLSKRLADLMSKGHGDGLVAPEDAFEDDSADEPMAPEDAIELAQLALAGEEVTSVRDLLRDVSKLGTDTKARRLVDHLRRELGAGQETAIVFTHYTDTVEYLREHLGRELDLPIGCFTGRGGERRDLSGAWTHVSKEAIKRLLRQREIRVLVCNDAAGEGLNLQTCGLLVNYDLPWNPMKVEQRIGRIDRIGQRHTTVKIINLAYEDTIEADVYFALGQRIGLFQGVVGKLQPILSRVERKIGEGVLTSSRGSDRGRRSALGAIDDMVGEAQSSAFDIDEVSEADMRAPVFSPPPFEPGDLDLVLARPDLIPAGVEVQPLESSTYAVRLPGILERARVTTRPGVFDEHFESHQLLAADTPIFRAMIPSQEASGSEIVAIKTGSLGDLLRTLPASSE